MVVVGAENILEVTINENEGPQSAAAQIQIEARISEVTYDETDNLITETPIVQIPNFVDTTDATIVYPRFFINSLKFLTTTPEHLVFRDNIPLNANEDYYTLFKRQKWWVTLKPEAIMAYLDQTTYSLHYALSAAADAMYLDALEVMKENASPKVSYSISPAAVDANFMTRAYNSLGQLAHINDNELKFENV